MLTIAPLGSSQMDYLIVDVFTDKDLAGNPLAVVIGAAQCEPIPWLRARGARWLYVLGPTGSQTRAYRARMQFYGGENPATGSAAGCAISYLVAHGAVASGRVANVRAAGSTVLVAKGQLFLP